jgi:hypothetical protein
MSWLPTTTGGGLQAIVGVRTRAANPTPAEDPGAVLWRLFFTMSEREGSSQGGQVEFNPRN